MKNSWLVLLLFIFITSAFVLDAHVITPPSPEPVQINLGDGLVFYLTPLEFEERGYPQSGLYSNGELIYTFDEGILWRNPNTIYFSNDAMSFLVLTGWHRGTIRFYERGVMTHYHEVRSLLRRRHRILDRTDEFGGSLAWWIKWDEIHYDRTNDILRITTIEDSEITFDLSTGAILSQHVPPHLQSGQVIMTRSLIWGALLISGLVIVVIKKNSHKK